MGLGIFNVVVALTIAVTKGLLVVPFFMHLIHTRHRTQVVAAAYCGSSILIVFTLGDVLTRGLVAIPSGW